MVAEAELGQAELHGSRGVGAGLVAAIRKAGVDVVVGQSPGCLV
jgi:hypothetical protein